MLTVTAVDPPDNSSIHYVLPVFNVMFVPDRPGKGDASRVYTQSDSPGGSTRVQSLMSAVALL